MAASVTEGPDSDIVSQTSGDGISAAMFGDVELDWEDDTARRVWTREEVLECLVRNETDLIRDVCEAAANNADTKAMKLILEQVCLRSRVRGRARASRAGPRTVTWDGMHCDACALHRVGVCQRTSWRRLCGGY